MSTKRFLIQTPAKLNLGLRILDKRTDGFHNLKTVFQSINLKDKLICRILDEGAEDRMSVTGPVSVASGPDNLVLKAVQKLRKSGAALPPLSIKLEKNIPVGAGLGGGSSDAAAVIHLAAKICSGFSSLSKKSRQIAAELGADVPFFLYGGTMLGSGIGEQLTSRPDQQAAALLVIPEYSISTEEAYSNFKKYLDHDSSAAVVDYALEHKMSWQELDLTNDFEPYIAASRPQHNEIVAALKKQTTRVALTGSGCAIYGLFEQQKAAQTAAAELKNKFSAVRCYVADFLSKREFLKIEEKESD